MKITEGTRVRIGINARQSYVLTGRATVTGTDRIGRERVYYVRDDAGTEAAMTRDEITPLPATGGAASSASVYGAGSVTQARKVRASVSKTPSKPRARGLKVYGVGERPAPRL